MDLGDLRHTIGSNRFRGTQGVMRKNSFLLPLSKPVRDRGPPAVLMAGGASDLGGQGLDWRVQEIEEVKGI
jgi:hypothetical protein